MENKQQTIDLLETWGKANDKIKELENLLNESTTGHTLEEDLSQISKEIENLKQRIEINSSFYEEDSITLGWTLDLVDYLYKIISIIRCKNK